MSPMPCIQTYQALQVIDKLRGSENWESWKLLILANARALRIATHIEGSAQDQIPLMPRAREAYAKAESCARILILDSIAPGLLPRLCELGLQDNASAADLMRWLHIMVSTREADTTAYDDLATLMRIDRKDFPSMDAYGKQALNLWTRIRHFWPTSANVIAVTSILEGMKQYNEHAYQGWKHFMALRKGNIAQQEMFDFVTALRDQKSTQNTESEDEDVNSAGDESVYSQSSE
ncbi:hypothetical protein TARUN_8835 [Trichoderma arundinaceum]|uniref:Uncharacterized protein n=1 Tax=Trichoderma arundinaceum TaxID=490622 RepID=A0A395NBE0_TRIAR|nr:hypothetical protein TARUN_8835 [Trichoderma arundinaceum]